jgi:hypothetical protein
MLEDPCTGPVGYGAPLLAGIGIYRGQPIFYDLGNFVFQTATDPRSIIRDIGEGFASGIVALVRVIQTADCEGAHHQAGEANHGELPGHIIGQSRV